MQNSSFRKQGFIIYLAFFLLLLCIINIRCKKDSNPLPPDDNLNIHELWSKALSVLSSTHGKQLSLQSDVVLLEYTGSIRLEEMDLLPEEILPQFNEDVRTVILINKTRVVVGYYSITGGIGASSGPDAYQWVWTLYIVNIKENKVWEESIWGGNPPQSVPINADEETRTGSEPVDECINWIVDNCTSNIPKGATVTGTLHLPLETDGKEWVVVIDDDLEFSNGFNLCATGKTSTGLTIDYSITDVQPGDYYLYSIVRCASEPNWGATELDYFGIYGENEAGPPNQPNAEVPSAGMVIFDINLNIIGTQFMFIRHIVEADFNGARSLKVADLDGDTDIDFIASSLSDGVIAWWENAGDKTFTKHIIDQSMMYAGALAITDMDFDNDNDVVCSVSGISWWENDGSNNFIKHVIDENNDSPHSIYAGDLDGDSDVDLVGGYLFSISWWENDGILGFTKCSIDTSFKWLLSIDAADIDLDNDLDIVAADRDADEITLWENQGNQVFIKNLIDDACIDPYRVYAIDFDRDTDIDIIAIAYIEVFIYENDGSNNFSPYQINEISCAEEIHVIDMDNDNDLDILSAAGGIGIDWYENAGAKTFNKNTVANILDPSYVQAADIDGDGDVDVIAFDGDAICWWESKLIP